MVDKVITLENLETFKEKIEEKIANKYITNHQEIVREDELLEATEISPDFIQVNEILYQKKITSIVPSVITDLVGTTWQLNNPIQFGEETLYNIIFTYNMNVEDYCEILFEIPNITTWSQLNQLLPTLFDSIGATDITNNIVITDEKDNYLIIETTGIDFYSFIHYVQNSFSNLPVSTGTISFTLDGNNYNLTLDEVFYNFVFNLGSWNEPTNGEGYFYNDAFRTISIIGGTDTTNTDFIDWIKDNATMEPIPTYVYEKVNKEELPTIVNDRYLHTNSSTGNLEWSQLSVPNVVQDLTSNIAGTLDATAWGTLKSTHTATIASPTMTGLDSSYEFVNIKLSINSINQYVKLAKNTTNKYSGLFFIEESTNLYEITAYYNGTNIILRCATVK